MRKRLNSNLLLAVCVVTLALLCFLSIDSPIRFERQRAERESVVKQRLLAIRTAEERYRAGHNVYAGSFKELAANRLIADSLTYIPFSGNKRFALRATVTVGKDGRQTPLMECSAEYKDYLQGIDRNAIDNLTNETMEAGKFPGLKIGDLETPNGNAGNWE